MVSEAQESSNIMTQSISEAVSFIHNCWVQDPIIMRKKIILTPTQYEFVATVLQPNVRFVLTNSERQTGTSTVAALTALWYATTHDKSKVLVVSNSLKEARFLLEKVAFALGHTLEENKIVLNNGSAIEATTSATGSNCDLLLVENALSFGHDGLLRLAVDAKSITKIVMLNTTENPKDYLPSLTNVQGAERLIRLNVLSEWFKVA